MRLIFLINKYIDEASKVNYFNLISLILANLKNNFKLLRKSKIRYNFFELSPLEPTSRQRIFFKFEANFKS